MAGSRVGIPDGSPLLDADAVLVVGNAATVLLDGCVVVLALLRHGGGGPSLVRLLIAVRERELEIVMENPLGQRPAVVRPGGGRGLRGIAERAELLGGRSEAGPYEGPDGSTWRLAVRLPLTVRAEERS